MEKESIVEDLDHALKCVRGLYYQDKIFTDSAGKQGKQVEFVTLSDEDRNALNYLRTHSHEGVSSEISDFIERIVSNS